MLGKVAMAIHSYAGELEKVWEISKTDEVATFSAARGLGVLIHSAEKDLWITIWIDLGSGSTTEIPFQHPHNAIHEIQSRKTI